MSSVKSLLPCKSCPWRVENDATTIPNYNHAKACGITNTVGDGDAFRPIMACHHSTDERPVACKGYLAREGWSNLNVRLLLMKGEIENPSAVLDAVEDEGIELETCYEDVLDKLAESVGK